MFFKAFFGVLIAFLIYKIGRIGYMMDFNKEVYSHAPGPCVQVQGIAEYGSEDFTMLPGGKVLITSGLRYSVGLLHEKFKNMKGRIYSFDFAKPGRVKEVKIKGDLIDFNPHGIAHWIENDVITIFVISHPENQQDRVEVFSYKEEENILVHTRSIQDPRIIVGNTLVPTSETGFFITNFHFFTKPPLKQVEIFGELPWGSVLHYNEHTKSHEVAGNLLMPNGLARSNDGRYLYLVARRKFYSFEILKDFELKEVQKRDLASNCDNIWVDGETGDVFAGCHPVVYQLLKSEEYPDIEKAPSQILRLHMENGKATKITEIFADDGTLIGQSTGAVVHEKKMLIGSLRDKLLFCDILYAY